MATAKQVVRNTAATDQVTFYVDGTATDPDGAAVTVAVTDDLGAAVSSGAAANETGTGVFSYTVPPRSTLALLHYAWTGAFSGISQTVETLVEIVGGFYVATAEIRGESDLANTTDFDEEKLVRARRWFETLAERYCNRLFVPRYRRARIAGSGTASLFLPDWDVQRVLSVRTYTDAATFTSFDSTDLADVIADGTATIVRASRGVWTASSTSSPNLVVEYEAGMPAVPDDIAEAALIAIRSKLLNDNSGRPMLSVATADGVVRFAMPGPDRPTGIPDVDTVLNGYRMIPVG